MSTPRPAHVRRVAVIGGGIVGLAAAWEAARRGHSVTVIDPDPGSGATHAAAGMLAPVSELRYQEESLLALTRPSAEHYPQFIKELEQASGVDAGYQRTQTLVTAVDTADRQTLADLRMIQQRQGLEVEELTSRQARRHEPMLGPQLTGAYLIPSDHQVDPRALTAALLSALRRQPSTRMLTTAAAALAHEDPSDPESVTGVILDGGGRVPAEEVVLANGLEAARIGGLPEGLKPTLRPVYGDILRLSVPAHLAPLITSTVRGLVHGFPVYLVPRLDGTVVIGATQRENGSAALSAGGVYELLRDAQTLIPAVAELELIEAICRPRPATPDNAPLLGRCAGPDGADVGGLIVATGFFRHGVLLAPLAAGVVADLIGGQDPGFGIETFRPSRFNSSPSLPLHTDPPGTGADERTRT